MQGLVIQPVRLAQRGVPPGWRPALGQGITTSPVTPPGALVAPPPPPPVPIIDSALIAFVFDVLGATSSGILAYAASRGKNKLTYLFGTMAGILTFKAVGDFIDIRRR